MNSLDEVRIPAKDSSTSNSPSDTTHTPSCEMRERHSAAICGNKSGMSEAKEAYMDNRDTAKMAIRLTALSRMRIERRNM